MLPMELQMAKKIVTSDISAPVEGMLLGLEGQALPEKPSDAAETKPMPETQS